MGTDVYLESEYTDDFVERCAERTLKRESQAMKAQHDFYTALQATGSYFRDPDNASSLLALIGIRIDEIKAMLNAEDRMPVTAAAALRDRIAAAPLTLEIVAANPRLLGNNGEWLGEEPPDNWLSYFIWKRDRLLAVLDKSIAKGEPLVWSLGTGIDTQRWLNQMMSDIVLAKLKAKGSGDESDA